MQSLYLIGSYHKLSILNITIHKGTNLFDSFLNDYTEIILNLQFKWQPCCDERPGA